MGAELLKHPHSWVLLLIKTSRALRRLANLKHGAGPWRLVLRRLLASNWPAALRQ